MTSNRQGSPAEQAQQVIGLTASTWKVSTPPEYGISAARSTRPWLARALEDVEGVELLVADANDLRRGLRDQRGGGGGLEQAIAGLPVNRMHGDVARH